MMGCMRGVQGMSEAGGVNGFTSGQTHISSIVLIRLRVFPVGSSIFSYINWIKKVQNQ